MIMRKKALPHVILVVVVLVSSILYLASTRQGRTVVPSQYQPETVTADWEQYQNDEFGFRVSHPRNLTLVSLDPTAESAELAADLESRGGVAFISAGPGVMGVKVYSASRNFRLMEWLDAQDDRLQNEGERIIAGKSAFIMYVKGKDESFPNEKRAYLMDGDRIFEILTSFNDDVRKHVAVWDSFALVE